MNSFNAESIVLYPNPSPNSITIKSTTLPDSYLIYNTLGQVITQSKLSTFSDLEINISNLTKGMYFLKLVKNNSSQVLSFVKN